MIVWQLVADKWSGIRCEEEIAHDPSEDDFLLAFANLNARDRTTLCLEARNGRRLVIGGGGGSYVVYCSFSDDEFWNLTSSATTNERVMLCAGGQEGDFPARQIVDADHARQAGLSFIKHAQLDSGLRWERGGSS